MILCARVAAPLAVAVLVWTAGTAQAERVRYHYPSAGTSGPEAAPPPGVAGERVSRLGGSLGPAGCPLRPTHLITFRHPFTGGNVTVPMRLPEDLPRIEYRRSRIIYNYGSYTVEAIFLADGSVDVLYNNPGRPLPWCQGN